MLLRGHGRVALIDTGSFGMRPLLRPRLTARGLEPKDVTDLLLTHSHHDHSVNWPLFRHARIVIGARELAWSLEQPWGGDAGTRVLRQGARGVAHCAHMQGWRGSVSRHHGASRSRTYARMSLFSC